MRTTCLALLALLSVGLTACGNQIIDYSAPQASARTVVNHYTSVVNEGSKRMDRPLSASTTNCGKPDAVACRAAMEEVASESERNLHDLDMNPAPSCLKAADVELRSGLNDLRDGARRVIQGIDINDATLVLQGNAKIRSGGDHMNRAADLIRTASC